MKIFSMTIKFIWNYREIYVDPYFEIYVSDNEKPIDERYLYNHHNVILFSNGDYISYQTVEEDYITKSVLLDGLICKEILEHENEYEMTISFEDGISWYIITEFDKIVFSDNIIERSFNNGNI